MVIIILFVVYLLFVLLMLYQMDSFDDTFINQMISILLIVLFSFVSLVFGVIYSDNIKNNTVIQYLIGKITEKMSKTDTDNKFSPESNVLLSEADIQELNNFEHLINSDENQIINNNVNQISGGSRKRKYRKIKKNIIEDDNQSINSNDSYYISKY